MIIIIIHRLRLQVTLQSYMGEFCSLFIIIYYIYYIYVYILIYMYMYIDTAVRWFYCDFMHGNFVLQWISDVMSE